MHTVYGSFHGVHQEDTGAGHDNHDTNELDEGETMEVVKNSPKVHVDQPDKPIDQVAKCQASSPPKQDWKSGCSICSANEPGVSKETPASCRSRVGCCNDSVDPGSPDGRRGDEDK